MQGSDHSWGKETVLVVEDAEPIRKMVCAMLVQAGYRCLEAGDGEEAFCLLHGAPRQHP